MNEKSMCRDLDALMHFIDNAAGVNRDKQEVDGFKLTVPITEAAASNTYIETISNKADTLHLRVKESMHQMIRDAYIDYIRRLAKKFDFKNKEMILAFDYTDENFYGDVQGFSIHGWTGKEGIKGKFKFLTCSLIADCVPQKIPLASIPIRIGHYKSSVVIECLSLIKDFIGPIKLILFDRGFYDRDLMFDLTKWEYPFLIFVPKHSDKKSILYPMEAGEQIAIYNEYKVNKNKSKYPGENILIFLKQIYDPKSEKNYDWVFATNTEEILLEKIVITYKKRWRIETQFRVQDEAKIKSKSPEMKVRYFYFLAEQMLQVSWLCFHKLDMPFKKYLIELAKMSRKWTKTQS